MNRTETNNEAMNRISKSLRLRGKIFIKISVLAFLFLSAAYLPASAQVSFGVKGGLNLNYMSYKYEGNNPNSELGSNLGFHLGAYFCLPFSEKFSFQPEIQFSRRDSKDVIDYIELPLLISYKPVRSLQVQLGSNVAFLVSSKEAFYSRYTNGFEFGVTGGVRYNLPKGFFVSGRYYFGLSASHTVDLNKLYPILDPNNPVYVQGVRELNIYNRTIQFGIGYQIK